MLQLQDGSHSLHSASEQASGGIKILGHSCTRAAYFWHFKISTFILLESNILQMKPINLELLANGPAD